MLSLDIHPGSGAGDLLLGMTKESARAQMESVGYPVSTEDGNLDYFCENSLQLEYEDGAVRFIGVSDHPEIECKYGIIDVFDCDAVALFNLIARQEPQPVEAEPGETCFFPSQGINLWEADTQYDRKGGYTRLIYAQVGVESPIGT